MRRHLYAGVANGRGICTLSAASRPRQLNTLFQRILAIAYEKAVRRAWVKSVFLAGRCVDLRCARIGGSDRFVVDRLRGLGVA